MKNLFNDPRKWLAAGLIFFIIGAIDTWILGANSYAEMAWWSKSAYVGFMMVLGALFFRFFLLPLGYWIGRGIKKIFGK